MGDSASAAVAYGVSLGADEGWFDPGAHVETDYDDILRRMYGFVPTVNSESLWDGDGRTATHTPELMETYFAERRDFLAGVPVELHHHGYGEGPGFILATKGTHYETDWEGPLDISWLIHAGSSAAFVDEQDAILEDAIRRLDENGYLTREPEWGKPFDPKPGYLLFAFFG